VLAGADACRVTVEIAGSRCGGVGLVLEPGVTLLVVRRPATFVDSDATVVLSHIRPAARTNDATRIRKRLQMLVGRDTGDTLDQRASRHALLFVMEASDPTVRGARLELLRTALLVHDHPATCEG